MVRSKTKHSKQRPKYEARKILENEASEDENEAPELENETPEDENEASEVENEALRTECM